MMTVAEALPIALIPEQGAVAAMRDDMIHIGRLDIAPLFHALHTQRMRFKITLAGFVPCSTVASASGRACVLRMEGTMLITVFCAVGNERCAAGMLAWGVRSVGLWLHLRLLPRAKASTI